jgi:hypothetical protein
MTEDGSPMKSRIGFVSNSSSSSFIVSKSEKKAAEGYGLQLVAVKDILSILRGFKAAEAKLRELDMEFIVGYSGYDYFTDRIEDLEKVEDCYLSAPFDRDRAYELGINYTVFEGDL